jgi:hypothetical protein
LDIKSVVVIGASAWGPSATQSTNDYPGRCSALLLLSAVSRSRIPGGQEPFYFNIINHPAIRLCILARYQIYAITNSEPHGIHPGVTGVLLLSRSSGSENAGYNASDEPKDRGTKNDGEMLEISRVPTTGLSALTLIKC